MITADETGVFAIAVTPFDDDGRLLEEGIGPLAEFYLEAGVSGITILGMMGEAEKLLPEESLRVVALFVEAVGGRVPVVVGVSAPGLMPLATLAQRAMVLGASGVMVAPTPALKTDAAIYAYFEAVCDVLGSDIPVVLQDFPQTTGVHITVATLNRIIRSFPQIVMLKHEDSPGLAKLSAIRQTEADATRRISILTGNGGLFLPQEMARGADGAMTGFAYPEMLTGVVRRARSGDLDAAETLFDSYLPLVRYEQQPGMGLAVRKEILFRRRVLASPALRRPGYAMTVADLGDLDTMMARLERRLAQCEPG